MNFRFLEISLCAGSAARPSRKKAAAFFARCGIPVAEIVFFESPEDFRGAVYTRRKGLLKKIRAEFKKSKPAGLRLESRILHRKDWLDKWQADYRITPLGKSFILVPFWQRKEFKDGSGRLPLYLDPKAVFGSGLHASTQIALALLEKVKRPMDSCLDLGTGTGILSAAAHRLGAKTIDAYDLDAAAVRAAQFNLKLNGAEKFSVRRGNILTLKSNGKKYDLVCANLTASLLTKARRFVFLSVQPGGFLIVSGILSREVDSFRRSFRHPHFQAIQILKKKGWGGILYFYRPFR